MSELSPARAAAILAAFGADSRRWPDAERAALLAYLRDAADGAALLDAAGALDDLLAASRVPPPSAALQAAVRAAAPRRSPVAGLFTRARLWWAGLLFAAATAAGAVSGAAAAAAFEPLLPIPGYAHQDATAFGAIGAIDEGEQ